jgi:hypothetical protein
MADVYVDMSLGTGLNDGTSWANAYQALSSLSSSAGDDIWVKGTESVAAPTSVAFGGTINNPTKVHGCKSATTNEPPVQSDLIPGWRTGEARTEANKAYNDGDAPKLTITGAGNDLTLTEGYHHVYGINFEITADIFISNDRHSVYEECQFDVDENIAPSDSANTSLGVVFLNCEFAGAAATVFQGGRITTFTCIGCRTNKAGATTLLSAAALSGSISFIGCDFSDQAHTLISLSVYDTSPPSGVTFQNCQLHASTAIQSGSWIGANRVEIHQCANVTGKSSGTILNTDILSYAGDIVEETTAVRTGGASDGSSSWSLAFTPGVNETRDGVLGIIGPWMAFKVSGDGTAKTVSVPIANSGASDYNNDDVWLEVMYPSEGGTAQYDNQTSQMDLLGTPTAITDDTGSTWGTGANNHQTLSVSISPDYVGRAYCRVVLAKNFPSSPDTLYVDPLPVVS